MKISATGWKPKVDIREGIRREYEYYLSTHAVKVRQSFEMKDIFRVRDSSQKLQTLGTALQNYGVSSV